MCRLKISDEPRSMRIERAGATVAARATRAKKAVMEDQEEMNLVRVWQGRNGVLIIYRCRACPDSSLPTHGHGYVQSYAAKLASRKFELLAADRGINT